MSFNNLYGSTTNNSNNSCNKPSIINNYYNNYYEEQTRVLIRVDTSSNYYLNITPNDFNKTYELFVVNSIGMYLPLIDNNFFIGFTVKIVNATGNVLNIYSQGNQLIYSNLYLPKQGSTNTIENPNSLFVFCAIKRGDLFSWIMV